jgi:hypothetical protein
MIKRNTALSKTLLFAVILVGVSINTQVSASNAGAFLGGVLATKVVGNMRDRTEAEQEQAYYAQQSAQQPVAQQAPAAQQDSPEQRIKELDKLAAGGYITPEEYKAKKKAIVDSM